MTEEQQKGLTRLLDRLGTALFAIKTSVDGLKSECADAHKAILSQGNSHLTQMVLLEKAIEEARRDVEKAENAVDELRHDLTPVRGTPLASPRDVREERPESIELGPAKVPLRAVERVGAALPWIVLGALVALGLLIAAVYLSGARLVVEEKRTQQAHQQGDRP